MEDQSEHSPGGIPGSPVVRTGHFSLPGPGSVSGWGTEILEAKKNNVVLYIYLCFLVSYKWFVYSDLAVKKNIQLFGIRVAVISFTLN